MQGTGHCPAAGPSFLRGARLHEWLLPQALDVAEARLSGAGARRSDIDHVPLAELAEHAHDIDPESRDIPREPRIEFVRQRAVVRRTGMVHGPMRKGIVGDAGVPRLEAGDRLAPVLLERLAVG